MAKSIKIKCYVAITANGLMQFSDFRPEYRKRLELECSWLGIYHICDHHIMANVRITNAAGKDMTHNGMTPAMARALGLQGTPNLPDWLPLYDLDYQDDSFCFISSGVPIFISLISAQAHDKQECVVGTTCREILRNHCMTYIKTHSVYPHFAHVGGLEDFVKTYEESPCGRASDDPDAPIAPEL